MVPAALYSPLIMITDVHRKLGIVLGASYISSNPHDSCFLQMQILSLKRNLEGSLPSELLVVSLDQKPLLLTS